MTCVISEKVLDCYFCGMRFCSGCGASLAGDARFCVECGAAVPPSATPAPPARPPAPAVSPPRGGAGPLRFLLAAVVLVVAVSLIRAGLSGDKPSEPAITTSPSAQTSAPPVSPSARPVAASSELLQAVGEWTVDPNDPLYSKSDSNILSLHSEGAEIKGPGPENGQFRFWDQGTAIVGEATDARGKSWRLGWEWLESGARARLSISDGHESQQVTLIRPSATTAVASPLAPLNSLLFEARGDVNCDGSTETVRILSLVPGAQAKASSDKQLEILSSDGTVVFASERFKEPFRADLDDTAETPDQKAGLHILEGGGGYPVIRVIFVCRSGNFVDFRYNGHSYELAVVGD